MDLNSTSNETEKALIASIIVDGGCITEVASLLTDAMFEDKSLAAIYRSIIKLYDNGTPIDLISLSNQMVKDGAKKREVLVYLTEISLKAASGSRAHIWAKDIADAYMRREFRLMAANLVRMTSDDTIDIADSLDYISAQSDKIVSIAKIDANNKALADVSVECITLLNERIKSRKIGQKTGIPTGIDDLDFVLGGFKPKTFVVFAGRPGMGKTSVAISFAKYAALKGYPSLIFSLEMPSEQIVDKLLLSECSVDSERYRDGFINKQELEEIESARVTVDRLPLRIDDSTSLTIRQLKSKATLAKKKHGIKLVVIDYIQLMTGKDKAGNREQEISSITRGLKQMANELDLTVIALSQLNREVEKRADKVPMLSDLRESGAIEQDADIVLFAYRPEYYEMQVFADDESQQTKGVGRIIVSKHRGGSTGAIYFGYDKALNKIGNKDLNIKTNDYAQLPVNPNAGFDTNIDIPF